MTAQHLIAAIDPCSGQAAFALPLLSRAGIGGLDLTLGARYDGGTLVVATGWNQDAPTGVMGLGWTIGRDRIWLEAGQSALPGDARYFIELGGVRSQLACIDGGTGGVSSWATAGYRFWQIRFDAGQNLWTVIDEDGLTYRFGGAASGRSTVDWGVAWGGWSGATGATQGQRAVAVGWSLAEVQDLFGNRRTYSYNQVAAPVAATGLSYTQASYLASVTGVDGAVLTLTYAAKSAAEYQDPHADPAPPNGWQDRFETQYLASVALADASGAPVASVVFGYATDLGSGGLTKRVLTSLTRLGSAGVPVEPPTLFSYYGENGGDGVSATTIFAGSALYGAMKAMTLPAGGTIGYTYQAASLSYAARSTAITSQSGWVSPVVYAGADEVLVTWLAGTTVHIMSYVWEGRWIPVEVMQVPLGAAAYSTLQVAAGDGCCAAVADGTLYTAARDRTRTGAWFPAASLTLAPTIGAGEAVALACGTGFAAALGLSGGKLLTTRFTGTGVGGGATATGWTADAAVTLGAAGGGFALAANGAALVAVIVPATGGASLRLAVLGASRTWHPAAVAPLGNILSVANLALQCGAGFAVVSSFAAVPGGGVGTGIAVWWDATGARLSSQAWPGSFAASAPTPVVAGSTVVVGQSAYRFTGDGWTSFALGTIGYAGTTGLPVLSVGADAIARLFTTSGGGSIADLLVYDPVAGSWAVPTGLSVIGAGAAPLAAVAAQTRTAVADYAVVGTKLWFRAATGSWRAVLTLPAGMTAADFATVRLIGDSYLVLQTGTGTTGVTTLAYLLKNGVATAAPGQPPAGQQIALPSGTGGGTVSQSGFATFTGTFGAAASQLALYRPVFGDVAGAQTGYVVGTVTGDSGYAAQAGVNGRIVTAFGYQSGTIDRSGTVPAFNTVTAVPGQSAAAGPASGTSILAFYIGLTDTETPTTAYPAAAGNASSHTAALRGTLYQSAATATGTGGAQTNVTEIVLCHQVTLLPLGTAGVGAYHRPVQQAETQDGVTGTDGFTYDATSGFVRSRTGQVVNAAGTTDSFSEQYTYFYEQYDPTRALNLLSPVVQRIRQSQPAGTATPATIAIDVAAWRDWTGSGQWAEERGYRGLGANATFAAWTSGQIPPATDFALRWQVTGRAATGAPVASVDALGTAASVLYDQAALSPVASVANCPAGQFAWYGCEPYESSGAWTANASGRSIADYLTTADYHTGTRALLLPAGSGTTGPLLALVPADQSRRYLFSCWARTPAGFAPASGAAQWTLTLYDPATLASVGTPIALVLTPTGTATPSAIGQWAYFQVTIDLPALVAAGTLTALGIAIQATNANTTQPCYVDELRFMPLDAGFSGAVYDAASLRPTAAIDGNGQPVQLFYDQRDRAYLSTGADGRVLSLAVTAWSRWAAGGTGFDPTYPNLTLTLGSAVGSVHYDFHDGSTADWTFATPADWSVANGALSFTGAASDTATSALLPAPNQAARVIVTKSATASASVALGNGEYTMRWTNPAGTGAGAWTLEGATGTLATNAVAPFDPEWLFAVIDGMVLGYAGSQQLFAYLPTPPASLTTARNIVLTATAPASFDDLTILKDPSFTLSASDGLGRGFASLELLGYQPTGGNVLFPGDWVLTASQTFYDTLGRRYVTGQSLEAPLQIAPPTNGASYDLVAADQDTYLYSDEGAQLTVPGYLAGTDGRTFDQTGYEASPLDRAVARDAPRAAYATGDYYCTQQVVFGSATTLSGAPAAGAGLYNVRQTVALRQSSATPVATAPAVTVLDQTTTDSLGRVLMRQSGPAAGPLLQTGYGYDAAGRLATISHPNCYAPPAGSIAADWQETLGYDFLGRLTTRTAPDSGTRQWAYDSLDRVRFLYLASGAPAQTGGVQTILYRKYDALGRVTETGYIRDARYAWGNAALAGKLDDPGFPDIVATPSGSDDATGLVGQTSSYDTDDAFTAGASFTRFLIGRAASAAITPSDGATGPDRESYGYDAAGNMVAKTLAMPTISPASGWTTRFAYNLNNQILSISYPDLLATAANPSPAGTPVTVGYGYDRLGRLAAVGGQPSGAVVDPAHPPFAQDMSYAGYSYDTLGRPIQAQYNNAGGAAGAPIATAFSYDANQRLSATTAPFFAQALSYDSSATVDGWRYFGASVMRAVATYPGGATAPQPPAAFDQQFSYDGYGRIAGAANALGPAYSLTIAGYDPNGNIQGKSVGASTIGFSYTPPTGSSPSNRVITLTTTASAAVDFTQTTPVLNGWTYGSSNNGPPTSMLTTATPVPGTGQALKLAGGSEGHYEVLRLATFLTPGTSYTLAWSSATDSGYPATPGAAVDGAEWFVVLTGGTGPAVAQPLSTIAAANAWTDDTVTIDLTPTGLVQAAGDIGDVIGVTLELRNRCLGANGAAGAAVYLKSVSVVAVSAPATVSTYGYDADGNVTLASGRGLDTITYDAVTGLTASTVLGTGGNTTSLAFAYGADRRRSRATTTPSGGGATSRMVTLTGPHGQLLATQRVTGASVAATYYVGDRAGPFAQVTDAGVVSFVLRDRLGSLRAVIDGPSGTPVATRDYAAFGETQRATGATGTDLGFTGQRLDAATGLYNYNARLYDPLLGRFYAPDPLGEHAGSYGYVGNDPVNFTDPSGLLSQKLQALIDNNWDQDEKDDFFIVDELFRNNPALLQEYYFDALPNVIWKMRYPDNVIAAFGRGEDELRNFTRSFNVTSEPEADRLVHFYMNFPGQAGYQFEAQANRPYFLQFLRVAMALSRKIYVNLFGVMKTEVVDLAFNQPEAILYFFDMTNGYDGYTLNMTSVAAINQTVPTLIDTLYNGTARATDSLAINLFMPGHTAWEMATIVTNSTLRDSTTFFNGTDRYSYQQLRARIAIPPPPTPPATDPVHDEL